jgi:hypothetical protein
MERIKGSMNEAEILLRAGYLIACAIVLIGIVLYVVAGIYDERAMRVAGGILWLIGLALSVIAVLLQ